jgi:hypothetical protein
MGSCRRVGVPRGHVSRADRKAPGRRIRASNEVQTDESWYRRPPGMNILVLPPQHPSAPLQLYPKCAGAIFASGKALKEERICDT